MFNSVQRRSIAANTARDVSATGKSLPVGSRLSATPIESNQRIVAATSKAASMFRTMLREPL